MIAGERFPNAAAALTSGVGPEHAPSLSGRRVFPAPPWRRATILFALIPAAVLSPLASGSRFLDEFARFRPELGQCRHVPGEMFEAPLETFDLRLALGDERLHLGNEAIHMERLGEEIAVGICQFLLP